VITTHCLTYLVPMWKPSPDQVQRNSRPQRQWPERFPERFNVGYNENQAWLYELRMPAIGSEDDEEAPSSDIERNSSRAADQISDEGDGSIIDDNASDITDDSLDNRDSDPEAMDIETVFEVLLQNMEDYHSDRRCKMLEFYFGVSVTDLRSSSCDKRGVTSLALLDERNPTSKRPREYKGPLISQELFAELQRPVSSHPAAVEPSVAPIATR